MPASGTRADPMSVPRSIRVLRTLGNGRAARAQLVEATMPDGRVVTCVEKVFAPGLLTRAIYRLSFQAPFAYQSNRDAILACYYRRRVAAGVLAASDVDVSIAAPLYVRYDQADRAWVLAAEWIDGRGIKPAPADASRVQRWCRELGKRRQGEQSFEVDELVGKMHQLESLLGDCGLTGSGWQVAPRALVSTANLLRQSDRYTVIDLESGIPAVLVPRYMLGGARLVALPPFDDLDPEKLRQWIDQNERLLTFRLGPDEVHRLRGDIESLIHHSARWKDSEIALFRRPWRLLSRHGTASYRDECLRRWRQDGVIDAQAAQTLRSQPLKARMIWYAGLLPSALGRICSRMIGRHDYRQKLGLCLRNPEYRADQWQRWLHQWESRLVESERMSPATTLTGKTLLPHLLLKTVTPARMHRYLLDQQQRRQSTLDFLLLLFSPRYQAWFGRSRIENSIDRWEKSQRISRVEADSLRSDLCGDEVGAYTRGLGMHLALKATAPLIVPAKAGGIAAFFAGGNFWFLLPLVATPLIRTMLTLANWWTTRHQSIPHGEALATGWLPVIGSIAFPLQMFSTRSTLSTFLVRDAASQVGRRMPIYGGADSRTEIALIRCSDLLVEFMDFASKLTRRLVPTRTVSTQQPPVIRLHRRSRWGRVIDRLAAKRIQQAEQESQGETAQIRHVRAA